MAVSLGVKAVIFTGTLAGVTIIDTIRVFKVYKKMAAKVNTLPMFLSGSRAPFGMHLIVCGLILNFRR